MHTVLYTLCGIQNHIIYVLVWSLKFKDFEPRSTMQSSKRALYNTYACGNTIEIEGLIGSQKPNKSESFHMK